MARFGSVEPDQFLEIDGYVTGRCLCCGRVSYWPTDAQLPTVPLCDDLACIDWWKQVTVYNAEEVFRTS